MYAQEVSALPYPEVGCPWLLPKPCGESGEMQHRALPLEECSAVQFRGQNLSCRREAVRKHDARMSSRAGFRGPGQGQWVRPGENALVNVCYPTTPYFQVVLKARLVFSIVFKDMTVAGPTGTWDRAGIEEISKQETPK